LKKETKKRGWFACLMDYAAGSKGQLICSVVLSVVSVASGIIPYFCVYKILDAFIADAADVHTVLSWCTVALTAYVVKVVFFGLSTSISHNVAYHILEKLRLRVADRLLHAPLGEATAHSIGEIKNIMVDKIENIEPPLAHMIPEGAGHIVLPAVSIIALAVVDWRIALASLITVPFSFICMALTFKISGKNFIKYNESNAYMNSVIVEYIEGIEVIKAFGRAGVSYEKFAKAIKNYNTFIMKWLSSTWVTMKLAFALFPSTLLGTLPVALLLGSRGEITAAEAALCVMLSMSMVASLAKLEVFSESIREMQFTIENLQEFLTMPELPEPSEKAVLRGGDVELHDVHFSYTGDKAQEVLHGIDLTLSQGSITALVGPSGGGKSTVAKLIARFWDVTSGEIRIAGVNVKNMPLSQLADTVSFVTQDNFLFRCSLLENIRLGNPKATDEEVCEAARAAQCEEFIQKLTQGYDTPAGEAGKRLSGGEKQRIAIARMILKNAPVVILDEATAFTDPENEDKIQRSIAALTKGKTLLVIAHRLSTIRGADNIVVLESGEIVAEGNQNTLLETCPVYKNMWEAHIGAKNWAVSAIRKGEALNV
jgi:ATP-binding cassette subfamily B protein IrtA